MTNGGALLSCEIVDCASGVDHKYGDSDKGHGGGAVWFDNSSSATVSNCVFRN